MCNGFACSFAKKGNFPEGEAANGRRMQKRANFRGWRLAIAILFAIALTLPVSVAGLHFGAGMIGTGRPASGQEPTHGLRGAEEGVKLHAVRGPVEHQ